MDFFVLFFGAVFVNNVVLTQFLGVCPFLGVSKDSKSAIGMGVAVIFVIIVSSMLTWFLNVYLLEAFNIQYMQTITIILMIASIVQIVEVLIKRFSPKLYKSMGVYLALITTNCAVVGTANNVISKDFDILQTFIYSTGISIGFLLAMYVFSTIRQRLEIAPVSEGYKGNPIALITAAIMALSLYGLGGLV